MPGLSVTASHYDPPTISLTHRLSPSSAEPPLQVSETQALLCPFLLWPLSLLDLPNWNSLIFGSWPHPALPLQFTLCPFASLDWLHYNANHVTLLIQNLSKQGVQNFVGMSHAVPLALSCGHLLLMWTICNSLRGPCFLLLLCLCIMCLFFLLPLPPIPHPSPGSQFHSPHPPGLTLSCSLYKKSLLNPTPTFSALGL